MKDEYLFNPALLYSLSKMCEGFQIRYHSADSLHKTPPYWSGWVEQIRPYYALFEATAPNIESLVEALFNECDLGFPSTEYDTGYGYREI